jgi:hypothetical protein
MALDTVTYDILPYHRDFDLLGNLYYVERLIFEANTDGEAVTPKIDFSSGTSESFTTFSSTVREFNEVAINRLGPIDNISFTPINEIYWYGVEMHIRPIQLGVQIVNSGSNALQRITRIDYPGRTSDASTSISFDINPFSFPEDARHVNPVLRYLWLDIVTGAQTVTPVLVNDQGTETTLTAITAATRAISEFSILATNRIRTIRLDGDFTHSSVILYDIEADLYLPNKRRMAVG